MDQGFFEMHNSHLRLLKPLNYEKQQSYRLTVTALDNGQPPMLTSVAITVIVTGPSTIYAHNVGFSCLLDLAAEVC